MSSKIRKKKDGRFEGFDMSEERLWITYIDKSGLNDLPAMYTVASNFAFIYGKYLYRVC